MEKILRPFSTVINNRVVNVFIKITYKDGKLSLTGVEGPRHDGNCAGACGQIDMHEWNVRKYADGWDAEKVARLRRIWSDWHLNDMRAYSPEMKALGWHEKASVKMLGYEYTQTDDVRKAAELAKDAALEALQAGQTFTPTRAQTQAASLPYSVTVWEYADRPEPEAPEFYKRSRNLYSHTKGNLKPAEPKTLGWLKPSEHPDGLLGRKIDPDDEHGYGAKWWKEDVPADVLQWLEDLPDADAVPAWV